MNWWIWIAAGIVLAICEVIFMPGVFVLLFFGLSACLVGALLGMGVPAAFWLQVLVFALLAVVLIIFFRKKAQRMLGMKSSKIDFDTIVGGSALAKEEINPGCAGKVEFRGSIWTASNAGVEPISSGEQCRITDMQGLVLNVKSERE